MHQRQDFDHRQIQTSLNRHSFPYMREPAKWYFDQNSADTSAHHPPTVENMMSLQSSPYSKQHLVGSHFQQQQERQSAETSYAYQNYGFQPIVPSEYGNREMVPKTQVLIHNQAGEGKRIPRPITSSVLIEPVRSHLPITTQVSTPYYQNYRNRMPNQRETKMPSPKLGPQSPKNSLPRHQKFQGEQSLTVNTPNTSDDKLVPRVDVQPLVDKNEEDTIPKFVQHGSPRVFMTELHPTQNKTVRFEKTDEVDASLHHEISMEETASVQPERKITESTDKEGNYQASPVSTTQVIPETDTMPTTTNEANLLTSNNPTDSRTWYNQYRPSTPLAPEILEKVVYFQEKIDERSKESSEGHQNEIKMSTPSPTVQSPYPAPVTSEDASQVLTDKISTNDHTYLPHSVTTEFGVGNTTQVCYILKIVFIIQDFFNFT